MIIQFKRYHHKTFGCGLRNLLPERSCASGGDFSNIRMMREPWSKSISPLSA